MSLMKSGKDIMGALNGDISETERFSDEDDTVKLNLFKMMTN